MGTVPPRRVRQRTGSAKLGADSPAAPADPPAPDQPKGEGSVVATKEAVDRSSVIGEGLKATAAWSLRLIIIGVAVALALWLLAKIWVGVLPIVLAIIFSTVLWPPVAWLRRHGWPAALAAAAVTVGSLVVFGGLIAAVARPLVDQSVVLANSAVRGIQQVQRWLAGPPLNLANERIDEAVAALTDRLESSASQIATGVFNTVSAASSALVTSVLVLVLAFYFVKDGPAFLPWVRRQAGGNIGRHLTELCVRVWKTLGDFIRVQAIVSFVDAVLIGVGLLILGVPLAGALTLLTFFAGFIPIVGALAAGGLAILVALVSNGLTTALLVLGLVVLVQQIEGNVLQPVLQGRSLNLHAVIVLLAVTAGGTLFGITGAFLAVPAAAVVVAILRYLSEQISLRTGELRAEELKTATPEGTVAAERGEQEARRFRLLNLRRNRDKGL